MTPEQERDRAIALSLGPDVWRIRWVEAATPAERWHAFAMYQACLDREANPGRKAG